MSLGDRVLVFEETLEKIWCYLQTNKVGEKDSELRTMIYNYFITSRNNLKSSKPEDNLSQLRKLDEKLNQIKIENDVDLILLVKDVIIEPGDNNSNIVKVGKNIYELDWNLY